MDLEQAVKLGLEIVVERGGAEADVRGDVGPLRVLVAVAAEMLDRGRQDLLALAAGALRATSSPTRVGSHVLGHHSSFD